MWKKTKTRTFFLPHRVWNLIKTSEEIHRGVSHRIFNICHSRRPGFVDSFEISRPIVSQRSRIEWKIPDENVTKSRRTFFHQPCRVELFSFFRVLDIESQEEMQRKQREARHKGNQAGFGNCVWAVYLAAPSSLGHASRDEQNRSRFHSRLRRIIYRGVCLIASSLCASRHLRIETIGGKKFSKRGSG